MSKLTQPQRRLLDTIAASRSEGYIPRGAQLRVAERLKAKGLVRLSIKGDVWEKGWYYLATLTRAGRERLALEES